MSGSRGHPPGTGRALRPPSPRPPTHRTQHPKWAPSEPPSVRRPSWAAAAAGGAPAPGTPPSASFLSWPARARLFSGQLSEAGGPPNLQEKHGQGRGRHSWGRTGAHKRPQASLLFKEVQGRCAGHTPGSGHDPGGAASLLVLPDVIVLVIVEGLDVVAAAGLEQSRAGLRDPTCPTRLPGARPTASQDGPPAGRGRPPWSSPSSPLPTTAVSLSSSNKHQAGTHAVLVSVDAKVDLCDPVKWSAERTVWTLGIWAGGITS